MSMPIAEPAEPAPQQRPLNTPSLRRQLIFWACTLLVFIALLWLLNDVLLPFVAGMVLAYLLDPLVRRLQKLGLSRAIASVVIVVLCIAVLTLALILIVPVLGEQIAGFVDRLPQYFERIRALAQEQSEGWFGRFVGERLPEAQKSLSGAASMIAGWAAGVLASIWSGGKALVSLLSLMIITPIVAFYLLVDWERMVAKVDSWIPLPYKDTVRGLMHEMDSAISGFLRGQALVCLILGTFYSVALIAIGLHFGLLIGIAAAVLGFAPYIGTMTGFLLAVGVAVAQFWPDWTMPALAAGIFALGQFIEGNILQPNLVGKSIGLHPVWLMFALLAFGYLFGFVGLLVAVPVAAAIGVLVRFLLRQYLASSYYTGARPG
jgi:predicted PurR-regulated permease PerM